MKLQLVLGMALIAAAVCAAEQQEGAEGQAEAVPEGGGAVVLAKIQPYGGGVSYQVMSPEEFRALQDQIRKETEFFGRALAAAQKEWKSEEATKRKAFPRSSITPRRASIVATFTDRERAEARQRQIEDKEVERIARGSGREIDSQKTREQIAKELERGPGGGPDVREAVALFEVKLGALMNPSPAADLQGAPPAAPAPQAPPAPKRKGGKAPAK